MYQKYANGLPLYRQEKDWKQYGAQISRTTLANWSIYCSQNYFQPMYDYFHRELLKRSFAMADETRVQVLNEEGEEPRHSHSCGCSEAGRMDSRRSSCMSIPQPGAAATQRSSWKATTDIWKPMAIRVTTTCRGSGAAPAGHISADTLSTQFPKGNSMTTSSRQCRESSTVIDSAETYLEDGRCSFTNNLSENAIRPFSVGRKNWRFSSSVDGTNANAVVYTIIEMAKAHRLNIYGYLKFLLEHRPDKDMTDEQLAELTPWSEKLQSIKNRI